MLAALAGLHAACARCDRSAPPVPTPTSAAREAAAPRDSAPGETMLKTRLEELRRGGRETVVYVPPTEDEERAYRTWLRAVAAGNEAPAPPGFALEKVDEGWLLAETRKRGAGAVVLRTGSAAPVLIEAPHTFFDTGTLPIALAVFARGNCRALLINTVHRYRGKDAAREDDESSPSDVAHAARSFFLAAHEELMKLGVTVQLHGFRDEVMPGVDVILSAAGTSADLASIAAALKAEVSLKLFPDEVKKLGGTTNVQARASARAGAPFVHVEISHAARTCMAGDASARERFADALLRGVRP